MRRSEGRQRVNNPLGGRREFTRQIKTISTPQFGDNWAAAAPKFSDMQKNPQKTNQDGKPRDKKDESRVQTKH